jgi:hypothetical protein
MVPQEKNQRLRNKRRGKAHLRALGADAEASTFACRPNATMVCRVLLISARDGVMQHRRRRADRSVHRRKDRGVRRRFARVDIIGGSLATRGSPAMREHGPQRMPSGAREAALAVRRPA